MTVAFIPVTSSASQGELTKAHAEIAGTCPFDDPDSDLYEPAPAPEDTNEWRNE